MFRFVVLLFSIAWASLLLLSWSSAEPTASATLQPASAEQVTAR